MLDTLSDEALAHLEALPAMRRAFVLAYAAPDSPTYGEERPSAHAAGYRAPGALLESEAVRIAVLCVERDLQKATAGYAVADAAWLHHRLTQWAHASILDFVRIDDATGAVAVDLRLVKDRPDVAQLVESIETEETLFGVKTKLKLVSPAKVMELLGRHAGVNAWRESIEVRDGDRADKILRARERRRLAQGESSGAIDVTAKARRVD